MTNFTDEFIWAIREDSDYEEDLFDGILPGDVSPVEAERISAVGRNTTLWEDT